LPVAYLRDQVSARKKLVASTERRRARLYQVSFNRKAKVDIRAGEHWRTVIGADWRGLFHGFGLRRRDLRRTGADSLQPVNDDLEIARSPFALDNL